MTSTSERLLILPSSAIVWYCVYVSRVNTCVLQNGILPIEASGGRAHQRRSEANMPLRTSSMYNSTAAAIMRYHGTAWKALPSVVERYYAPCSLLRIADHKDDTVMVVSPHRRLDGSEWVHKKDR
jgi:hypothetical protein